VPWADAVYGCDEAWWLHRKGLPEFKGLKLCYRKNGLQGYPDIRRIGIPLPGEKGDHLALKEVGEVGSGGNSGFQAFNLAVQFGAKRILLVGFDMINTGQVHWYGRNSWTGANNPDENNFRRWRKAFENASRQCRDLGIEVINCSPYSALDCFPKMTLEESLN